MTANNYIQELTLENFTVFEKAHFEFSPGLNLIVGENGAGKTHLLKMCYSIVDATRIKPWYKVSSKATNPNYTDDLKNKLEGVFKVSTLQCLARKPRGDGPRECAFSVRMSYKREEMQASIEFDDKLVTDFTPTIASIKPPIYLPPRELVTIAPGFVSLYETAHLEFEETYRDTILLLQSPLAKGAKEARIKKLLKPIEEAMEGKVEVEGNGRFYLKTKAGKLEMHLVAEGMRKLAMVARLIATGHLVEKGFLFWDEPEANLNPKVVKSVAKIILNLCREGIQVFVATHSLFLMRELDIQLRNKEFEGTPARFFGLHRGAAGVTVEQGESIDDIGEITSLQEELSQSDRYLASEAE